MDKLREWIVNAKRESEETAADITGIISQLGVMAKKVLDQSGLDWHKGLDGYIDPSVATGQKRVPIVKPRHGVHIEAAPKLEYPFRSPKIDAGTPIVVTPGFDEPNEWALETEPVKSERRSPDSREVDDSSSEEESGSGYDSKDWGPGVGGGGGNSWVKEGSDREDAIASSGGHEQLEISLGYTDDQDYVLKNESVHGGKSSQTLGQINEANYSVEVKPMQVELPESPENFQICSQELPNSIVIHEKKSSKQSKSNIWDYEQQIGSSSELMEFAVQFMHSECERKPKIQISRATNDCAIATQ